MTQGQDSQTIGRDTCIGDASSESELGAMQEGATPASNESERASPAPESVEVLRIQVEELEAALQALQNELTNARERPYRKRLPTTRQSITHKFEIGQHEGYITVGLYEDGRPGELFLTMAKEGSTIGGLMDTVGVLTSLALQHGVSVEILARKFEYASFEPSGWTRNPEMRRAASTVDYVFRWLNDRARF